MPVIKKNSIVTTLSFKDSMKKMMVEGSTPYQAETELKIKMSWGSRLT